MLATEPDDGIQMIVDGDRGIIRQGRRAETGQIDTPETEISAQVIVNPLPHTAAARPAMNQQHIVAAAAAKVV